MILGRHIIFWENNVKINQIILWLFAIIHQLKILNFIDILVINKFNKVFYLIKVEVFGWLHAKTIVYYKIVTFSIIKISRFWKILIIQLLSQFINGCMESKMPIIGNILIHYPGLAIRDVQ